MPPIPSWAGAPFPGLTRAAASSRVLLLATLSLCGDDTGDCHSSSSRGPSVPSPEPGGVRACGVCLGHREECPALSCLCLTGPSLLLLLFPFSRSIFNPLSAFTDSRAGMWDFHAGSGVAGHCMWVFTAPSVTRVPQQDELPASPELEKNIQSPLQRLLLLLLL